LTAGRRGQQIAANQPPADDAIPANREFEIRGWEILASQRQVVNELFGVPPWDLYACWDK
jgi:hypothetical protein